VHTLFEQVFSRTATPDHFPKKYLTHYLSLPTLATVALHLGRPVAFYGAIPQRFGDADSSTLVAHSCEYFTHPDHRRKGLNNALAEHSYATAQSNGIGMTYAYHTVASFQAVTKLNWTESRRMQHATVKTGAIPWAKVKRKLGLRDGALRNLQRTFPAPEPIVPYQSGCITELITPELRAYRAFSNNGFLLVEGCLFWVKQDAALVVGMFSAPSSAQFGRALKHLLRACKAQGIPEIQFHVDEGHTEYALLTDQGISLTPGWRIAHKFLAEPFSVEHYRYSFCSFDTF